MLDQLRGQHVVQQQIPDVRSRTSPQFWIVAQEYGEKKAADPDFYRSADSMSYGKAVKDSDTSIDRMVKELEDRCAL